LVRESLQPTSRVAARNRLIEEERTMLDEPRSTAVITGAAGGIGSALARSFAEKGTQVVLADLDEVSLEQVATHLSDQGARVLAVPTDVTAPGSVERLAERTVSHFGGVDVVCNNAGIVISGMTWSVTPEEWQRIMSVNFMGVVNGIRSFIPILRAQNRGHMVNTASMAGVTCGPGMAAYAASKHAVVAVSECLYKELLAEGSAVRVSVLCPGMVETSMPARALSSVDPAHGDAASVALVDEAVRGVSPGAIAPERVADCVQDAIRTGRLWVFTHPERVAAITERARDMVEGRNPGAGYV
jgi:NAD(P)-dependent dehydrogenase (short-subunit alcohol dehydrogenase family)